MEEKKMGNGKKSLIIVTCIMTLLPMGIGLLLWNRLPDLLPTHWNFAGEIDGYQSKAFGVFFIPTFLLVNQIIVVLCLKEDPKSGNLTQKMIQMALWMIPLIGVSISVIIYSSALGYSLDVLFIIGIMLAVILIIMGNYLPKCRQNHVIGLRLPWTLNDEEIWNKTHRMAGRVWIAGGILLMILMFQQFYPSLMMVLTMVLTDVIPIVYSYILYVRKSKNQTKINS